MWIKQDKQTKLNASLALTIHQLEKLPQAIVLKQVQDITSIHHLDLRKFPKLPVTLEHTTRHRVPQTPQIAYKRQLDISYPHKVRTHNSTVGWARISQTLAKLRV